MTLLQIIQECTNRSDNVLSNSYWVSWINLAYHEVESILRNIKDTNINKRYTTTTVQNQSGYTLPTGFVRPIKMLIGTTEYTRVDYEDSDDTSISQSYYVDEANGEFVFTTAPTETGETIIFYYESEITELSNDSDEPYFPLRFHEILVDGAMSRYHEYEKEMGKAAFYSAKFQNKLTELVDFWTRYSKGDSISMKSVYDVEETDF